MQKLLNSYAQVKQQKVNWLLSDFSPEEKA